MLLVLLHVLFWEIVDFTIFPGAFSLTLHMERYQNFIFLIGHINISNSTKLLFFKFNLAQLGPEVFFTLTSLSPIFSLYHTIWAKMSDASNMIHNINTYAYIHETYILVLYS